MAGPGVMLAGPDPLMSDLSQVTVYRDGQRIVRDLTKLEKGDLSQNLQLEQGDLVSVPEALDTIVFMGHVTRPGPMNIHGVTQRDLAAALHLAQVSAASIHPVHHVANDSDGKLAETLDVLLAGAAFSPTY